MGQANEKFPYEEIVHLPHHVSKKHPQMALHDRAAQFSAFQALSGYAAAIQETTRLTDEEIEMEEDRKAELDRKLQEAVMAQEKPAEVTITYFQPDDKKAGGAYITATGRVKRIDSFERTVNLMDGQKILIDRIVSLEIGRQDGE